MRARVVLLSAQGSSLRAIAQQLGLTERTVCLWRRRYQEEGVGGLRSRRRSGRPRSITRAKEFAVVTATSRRPPAATHWSARRLAKEMGLSFMTVHRIWRKYGLQPHRVETFKFSTDPRGLMKSRIESHLQERHGDPASREAPPLSGWSKGAGPVCRRCAGSVSRFLRTQVEDLLVILHQKQRGLDTSSVEAARVE